MSARARLSLPTGAIPEYKDFVRHVWDYEDDESGRAIRPPPFVFEIRFYPTSSGAILVDYTRTTFQILSMDQMRMVVTPTEVMGTDALLVQFRDLEALYTFVCCIAGQVDFNETLRAAGRFVMWTLGFDWT